MKNKLSMFFIGLIVGVFLVIGVIVFLLPKQMIIVEESKLGFAETVEIIQKSAKENNWSMPHVYDLQATMGKHNFDVNPVKVFSLCKPEHAYKILSEDKERFVSSLMPCRIAVYENDGKTYISMLNAGLFSSFMGKKIRNVMSDASDETKLILKPVLN